MAAGIRLTSQSVIEPLKVYGEVGLAPYVL